MKLIISYLHTHSLAVFFRKKASDPTRRTRSLSQIFRDVTSRCSGEGKNRGDPRGSTVTARLSRDQSHSTVCPSHAVTT